jgi:hypothetical protein
MHFLLIALVLCPATLLSPSFYLDYLAQLRPPISSAPTTQTVDCCVNLTRDVILDHGDDYDMVTIEVGRHDSKLLVASLHKRFFASSDGGVTWKEESFDAIDPLGYGGLPPHPKNSTIRYRMVETRGDRDPRRLERSSDGGRTWVIQKCLLQGTNVSINVSNVFYHPIEVDTIYSYGSFPRAGVALNGFFLSHDGGQSFSFVLSAHSPNFALSATNPKVIYATGTSQSVVKSIDGGITWHLVGQNDDIRFLGKQSKLFNSITNIIVDPNNSDIVYLVSRKGIIRTADGGTTWCNLNLGGNLNTSIGYLALSPLNSGILFVGTTRGLFMSKSGGCGWKQIILRDRLVK